MGFYEKIKELFLDGTLKGKTIKQIFDLLGIKKGFEKDAVRDVLLHLEKDGVIFFDRSRYILFEDAALIKGVLRGHEKGFAFLVPENAGFSDFFIPPHALNGALHGDTVYVKRVDSSTGSSDEAEVVRIISRVDRLVGTYQAERTYGFVVPDDKGYFVDIFVPFKASHGAVTGDKVVVRIKSFPAGKNPEGEVEEILGKKYDLGAEERSIIAAKNIPDKFPEKVIKFIKERDYSVLPEYEDREDFRGEQIITIDGADARDLDDAISLKMLDNGHFLLGVHIADVSHYVPIGSVLDKEALRRSTSVYFPDTVIPMLPKELSNGICSLNEGEDRLTLSCIMEVDGKGEVVSKNICNGIIRSSRRMTYDAVDGIMDGDEDLKKEYLDILNLIDSMRALAEILIKKRDKRGSVELDVKEADIRVDARGEISITPVKRTFSHRIIEEFMILANETVAEFVRYTEIPFLYRVHENPTDEKVEDFISYLNQLGITVRWSAHKVYSSDFAKLLERLEDSPLFSLVNKVMLRSMSKAKYYPENLGHFGLASENYCHFTSPIRRYPDLIAHRAVKHLIDGKVGEWIDGYENIIYDIAKITSECERRADEAEWDVDDLFKSRYMKKHIGEEFDGIVSGVTSFGVFVELPNTVEGLIKLETLPKGNYDYDKKSFTLSSKKLSFKLGEGVRIMVAGVDSANRKVEFIFINKL